MDSPAALAWLLWTGFVVHNVEEGATYRRHGTRHFQKLAPGQFPMALLVITLIVLGVVAAANLTPARPAAWLTLWLATGMGLNGLIHGVGGLRFRRYVPGLISGVGLMPPLAAFIACRLLAAGQLSLFGAGVAALAALVSQAPLIWLALWLGRWLSPFWPSPN
jgi:hypothetical protein